jgi:hypothetical protein
MTSLNTPSDGSALPAFAVQPATRPRKPPQTAAERKMHAEAIAAKRKAGILPVATDTRDADALTMASKLRWLGVPTGQNLELMREWNRSSGDPQLEEPALLRRPRTGGERACSRGK